MQGKFGAWHRGSYAKKKFVSISVCLRAIAGDDSNNVICIAEASVNNGHRFSGTNGYVANVVMLNKDTVFSVIADRAI